MSGTEDKNFVVLNSKSAAVTQEGQQTQTGAEKTGERELTSSEKMNEMIRSSSPKHIHREMQRLRDESAKNRKTLKTEAEEKLNLQAKAEEIQAELTALKATHRSLNIMRLLDKAGCIKSELVAKDIPEDCKDFEEFIENYKKENGFLFQSLQQKQNRGGSYKPSTTVNLTPSQQMDAYIRQALGR